jgi:glycosyltransferase involved in cell wall biosynthesis
MKKALIFSFSFEGHRQIYAQYFIELLLMEGYRITLAADSSQADKSYPYLEDYRSNALLEFLSIDRLKQFSLRRLRKFQDENKINLSIFLEADDHLKLLSHQILPSYPRLRGKNLGIFIRSVNYIHQSGPAPKFESNWSKFRWFIYHSMRYPIRSWSSNPFIFHEITLPFFSLLDKALTPDEIFFESHNQLNSYEWFPDMIFPYVSDDPGLGKKELERWEPLLKDFIRRNQGKEIIFYFGLATSYKGYDTLLKFAANEKLCFIHCGLFDHQSHYEENVEELRDALSKAGLLFETNSYIQSYSTVKLFFDSCRYLILPYRYHLGSSGVMLQAIHFGKPVLVPDLGLMAARTQRFSLGRTYRHGDFRDLTLKWQDLKNQVDDFLPHLESYKNLYSRENVKTALSKALSVN